MMISPGIYKAVAIPDSVIESQTSNGNDQLIIDFELTDIGETVRVYLVITENTAKWVWKKLQAAGWDGVDLDTLDGLGSKPCDISIKYEMWQGANKMRTDIVMPIEPKRLNLSQKYGKSPLGFKL